MAWKFPASFTSLDLHRIDKFKKLAAEFKDKGLL